MDPRLAEEDMSAVQIDIKKTYLWPVYYSGHWVLAVTKADERTFDVFDSFRGYATGERKRKLGKISQLIRVKWGRYQKPLVRACDRPEEGSNDCGVFTVMHALMAMGYEKPKVSRTSLRRLVAKWPR
jgi:Ulp1 family protease